VPDGATWEAIKKGSTEKAAVLTITGYRDAASRRAVSRGRFSIRTSTDPVGAPIFYRDVPLMPSEGEKGTIKPLDQKFTPLIAWRLRNVAETSSRVVMTGLHSCANCHSVSRDGKTMGMDLDGPKNNKGLYALFPIQPQATIRSENVVEWSSFRGKLGGKLRVAFMSQVSPDGVYRIPFNEGRGGEAVPIAGASGNGMSNSFPKISPDGRWIVFVQARNGLLMRPDGKLYIVPAEGGEARLMRANTPLMNSWHSFSPNGRWLVFSSKSRSPYTQMFLTHVDEHPC
jgi:hypothetical protein